MSVGNNKRPMSHVRPAPVQRQRTAQQIVNYKIALAKLVDDMEAFAEVARRNSFKVHSLAWNHLKIYRTNGHKRRWSVTLFGDSGPTSRENPVPPVVYVRPPRPHRQSRN